MDPRHPELYCLWRSHILFHHRHALPWRSIRLQQEETHKSLDCENYRVIRFFSLGHFKRKLCEGDNGGSDASRALDQSHLKSQIAKSVQTNFPSKSNMDLRFGVQWCDLYKVAQRTINAPWQSQRRLDGACKFKFISAWSKLQFCTRSFRLRQINARIRHTNAFTPSAEDPSCSLLSKT